MADLLDPEEAVADAIRFGNFMLRLSNQTWPARAIAENLVLPMVRLSGGVYFPSYKSNWLDRYESYPAWAEGIGSLQQVKDGVAYLSPGEAGCDAVADFWVEGDFKIPGKSPPEYARPGLPVIQIDPASICDIAIHPFASSFVGYAIDMAKRKGHFRPAVQFAAKHSSSHPECLYVIYQDPSWLYFLGSANALAEGLRSLSRTYARLSGSGS